MKRKELIDKLLISRNVDTTKRITVKALDYSKNMLSPVETAYRVFFTDINGNKCKSTYFGENVGFQG